jgi:hypothetical protein
MTLRKTITAAAALLIAAAGLSACTSKIGTAATVGSHRISDSEVGSYVTRKGVDTGIAASASAAGQVVQPKVNVLDLLVKQQLFTQALARKGGVPSSGELASLHDTALETFLGLSATQLSGFDQYVDQQVGPNGYDAAYRNLLLNAIELETALAMRLNSTSLQDFAATVDKLHIPVSVSPRYGAWDAATLQMDTSADAGVPSFVTLHEAPKPSTPAG